jgi:hypothetical protein
MMFREIPEAFLAANRGAKKQKARSGWERAFFTRKI